MVVVVVKRVVVCFFINMAVRVWVGWDWWKGDDKNTGFWPGHGSIQSSKSLEKKCASLCEPSPGQRVCYFQTFGGWAKVANTVSPKKKTSSRNVLV